MLATGPAGRLRPGPPGAAGAGGDTVTLRKISLVAVLLLCMPALPDPGICGPVMERVTKAKTVRIGVPYNKVPQGFFDEAGKLVGFEADLAAETARHMNLKLDAVRVNEKTWGSMLDRGRIDIAMCRIRHTRSLENRFDFSVPYFFDSPHILVLKGQFKKPADLAGHKIAAVQGTSSERTAMSLLRKAGDPAAEKNVVSYPDAPSCFMALGREKVAGWLDSGLNLLEYASRKPGRFDLIKATNAVEAIALGLPQNDSAWRDFVNFTIQDMVADGSFAKIYLKWFRPESPYAFPMERPIDIWPQ
jgi:polar amino acid transport system substrate-binding protein